MVSKYPLDIDRPCLIDGVQARSIDTLVRFANHLQQMFRMAKLQILNLCGC